MCVMAFSEDLAYWGIDEIYLETCCQNKFNLRKEYIEEEIKKELLNIKQEEPDIFPETKCGNYMRFIWDLMEKSETSFAARIVSFLSISFIIISTYELITCFHEFCKYESTNFYYSNFLIEIKLLWEKMLCITDKTLCRPLKGKQRKFCEKNCRFVVKVHIF